MGRKGAERSLAVLALGGNALVRQGERGTVEEQRRHLAEAVAQVPALLGRGYELIVTHGNGPTVGQLLLQSEAAKDLVPPMPLDVCDADTEGSIGYLAQQALANVLLAAAPGRQVVSLITQVEVDPADPAFGAPSKPVGPFYSAAEAEALRRDKGWRLVEDAGRGFRRVVPSPKPIAVVEEASIRILLDHQVIVIAAGGGGIPVVRRPDGTLGGVEAVIDKDRASALLANRLGAEMLVILTAEPCVYRHYGDAAQEAISSLRSLEARDLLEAGEFPPGSMGPKIEAALSFLEGGGQAVLIASAETLLPALEGSGGTRILP